MANCININSKEFKELRRQTGFSEKVLAAKVGLWQGKNGIDNYPTKEAIYSTMKMSNILGIYKEQVSDQQRMNILQNLKRYKLFNTNPGLSINFQKVGIADLYTWKIVNPLEGQGTLFQLSDIDLISIEELEKNKMFQGTPVEFVSEIPTDKTTPVAFRNVNRGEKFLFVKDLFQKKFKDKAWTNPATQKDGSKATPLSENQFKTIEEFLTFALLHEKAHEYIFKNNNETIGEYEDRINTEAINKLPKEGSIKNKKASPKTLAIIKDFLNRIGVNVDSLKDIVIDGVRQDANGVALIMQKLIQVVDGKEAQALPEEAMHFAVEIIKQTDPKLYYKLLKEINNYTILNKVIQQYSNNKNYKLPDGKPNIIKLKEEAIGKVLAEVLIKEVEGTSETLENLVKVEGWWASILNSLRNLFMKSGFDTAAMNILSGKDIGTADDINTTDDSIFLQQIEKSKQDQIVDKLKEVSSKIGKNEKGYIIDGVQIKTRVSDLVKNWYTNRFNNNKLLESEFQKGINDLKAEKGTAGHADLEHVQDLFVDSDGLLKSYDQRKLAKETDDYISKINPEDQSMYEILRDNLEQRLLSFPVGTKFLSEQTIYDEQRGIAGTVDFLAITPEGKVNILDWKFMDLNVDKYTDIPWYKIDAWNIQMDQYKYILSKNYNVSNQDFEQTRMIPIKAYYSQANYKTGILPKLLEIAIGDVNVKNITEDYLLPVPVKGEKTGNKKIDDLIEKLNSIYQKMSEKKAVDSEKITKAEQLNALFSAIRQLQLKQNIAPLIYQAKILNKQIKDIILKYESNFKGKDAKLFEQKEISDFAEVIENAKEALNTYTDLTTELKFLFLGELTEEDKKLKEDLRDTVEDAREFASALNEVDTEFINDIIGKNENVDNLSSPEKIIKGITKFFANTATIQLKSLDVLYKKAQRAFTLSGMDTLTEVKRLEQIKKKYETWSKGKGLTIKNQFNILMKSDKNELINEFNSEFYSALKIKQEEKDFKWIINNVDRAAYSNYLDEKLKKQYEYIESRSRIGTDESNQQDINIEKKQAADLYNISTDQSVGWLLYNDVKKFPKRENWESAEWKELNNPVNQPALDFYNYIIERNNEYKKVQYINSADARVFLPWVRKGLSEKLIFGGNLALGEQFIKNISMDESDFGFGQRDPLTGELINTVPKYLINELEDGDYSTDLFKTMGLYNEFAIKFTYLTDIEAQGRALVRLERNKKSIMTSSFGKIDRRDGLVQYNPNNSENAKIVEDMVKAIIYQQRYIESDSFDQVLTSLGKFGDKINQKLGFNIFPKNMEGRQISINKVITQLNNIFQVNTLGLNVLSATSNLFGGKTQSFINSGVYFTKEEFLKTEMWLLSNKMGGEDKVKMMAALDYFIPFTDNYTRERIAGLSSSKFTAESIQDYLMILMRNGDKAVQTTAFFSYLRNSAVIDGKVVNARQYLKSTDEYKNFYKGTAEQRADRSTKFEKDVKDLIEEKGILKLSKVENDELVIPGVERKSESVVELTRKVQQFTSDALGNSTEANKRLINLNIYGNSFMVFKNWIPRLVDVRTGNLKYNSASEAYEWGRSRMVYRIISEDLLNSLGNLKNALVANDKGVTFLRELYEKKKNDYENDTNKELKMTEDQFIDLVRQNVKNQLFDTLFYAGLFALSIGLKALAPDDDEDELVRNQYKFILKATDKLKDELGYFYNPTNLTQLVQQGLFPSTQLINNYIKVLKNFMIENYAIAIGDTELEKKNNVVKYLMKSFPISSQAANLLPLFSPSLAKDLGIRIQSTYGVN